MLSSEGLAEFLTFGFTLDGKTMRKDLSIPTLPIPDVEYDINSGIDDVYTALKDSMERLIQPGASLALSGGLDSRILAGIAAELGEKIPTYSWGFSKFEKMIARKVASTLKLPHYIINIDLRLNKKTFEKIRHLTMETGGAIDLFSLYIQICLSQRINEHGVEKMITAYGFDEVNGSNFAYKASSTQQFCELFVQIHAHPLLPHEYREIAKKNLNECCKSISFNKLYPLIYLKNICKNYKVRDWGRGIIIGKGTTPIIDKKVLSTIISLPHEQRINKRLQKAILRKYFPKLYRIPYSISGLAPFLPYPLHIYMGKLVCGLHGFTNKQKPRPLRTFDDQWFMRINLHFLQNLLFSHVPPFMDTRTMQKLVYHLQTRGSMSDSFSLFLCRLSTYALLASQIN